MKQHLSGRGPCPSSTVEGTLSHPPMTRLRCRPWGAAFGLVIVGTLAGCQKKVEMPPMEVGVVEAYGLTLDESATPKQVAFVLLRSIRDDVEAAQARDGAAQRAAFETTYSLAAFSEIRKRLEKYFGKSPGPGLTEADQRRIYDVVDHWAPIVAHYVASFDEEYERAAAEMLLGPSAEKDTMRILYDVVHDPSVTDPAKQQRATIEIELTPEPATGGDKKFWRVARVAFEPTPAIETTRPASPVTATAPTP